MDRWIDFAGVLNFRDVGALTGRPGVLYRSDGLGALQEADRERFQALGVHTIIDLRWEDEMEFHGRAPHWACEAWHNVPLRDVVRVSGDGDDDASDADYLADFYLHLNAADVARVLTILADPATGPAVVHCAAGRDRTGTVVAVLLSLLGVSDEEIATDYAETEADTRRMQAGGEAAEMALSSLPPQAILLFLAQVRELHGSVQDYLVKAGLEPQVIATLRARMVAAAR